ncbi:hypothetical protein FQV37_1880 [Psychrobacter nivimaris]|uniref:Uncharacterized protein n=1 Tax=Psychrobacter nivimaris TaxID=281738 RepID=A0A6N7BVU0_9GAMM|nr:hypothetical protein FQV37_1880 [Psychrobacter nivimaris]
MLNFYKITAYSLSSTVEFTYILFFDKPRQQNQFSTLYLS